MIAVIGALFGKAIASETGRKALFFGGAAVGLFLWTGMVAGVSYYSGKRDQANTEELRRQVAINKALQADLNLQKVVSAQAQHDRDLIAQQKSQADDEIEEYKKRLANEDKTNASKNPNARIHPSQCPKTCAMSDDFINTIRRGRVPNKH